jgi:hypothetical protein
LRCSEMVVAQSLLPLLSQLGMYNLSLFESSQHTQISSM